MNRKSVFCYFKNPFPDMGGFSPYRFPGLLVHIPVLLGFLVLGYQLNENQAWLYPAIFGYCILGLYLGRDLAVYAHYNLYILILVSACLFSYKPWIAPLLVFLKQRPSFLHLSILIDSMLFLGFTIYVLHRDGYRLSS